MSLKAYLLNGPLGFGAAPLGNMFRNIPDDKAEATVDAAWQQGTRYFDTAPFYGTGRSEIRLGKALAKHKRDRRCLKWRFACALRDARVTSALIGARNVTQLEDSLDAVKNLEFSRSELTEIDQFAKEGGIDLWRETSLL